MATVHGNVLHMGPAGNQWHYHRKERLYDLTRGGGGGGGGSDTHEDILPSAAPLTIRTTAGPPDTSMALAPHRTALVVVDMQNFFLHRRCRDHPTGRAAVAPTRAAVAACRRAGIRVVWLNWGLTDADLAAMPAAIVSGFSRRMILAGGDGEPPKPSGLGVDLGNGCGRTLVKGAWSSNVYEGEGEGEGDGDGDGEFAVGLADVVRPDLGDVLCDKTRMSGLWSATEPLRREFLESPSSGGGGGEVRTLLFAGVNTDQCVLGTLTDAYHGGWDCVAIEDCCATGTPHGQAVTMRNVAVGRFPSPPSRPRYAMQRYLLRTYSILTAVLCTNAVNRITLGS